MIWGFWEPIMERDQKLVIRCASKGDFHSPRAVGGLFWGFSLPRETGTMCLPCGVRGLMEDSGIMEMLMVPRDTSALWTEAIPVSSSLSSPQSRSGTEVALNRAENT